MSRVQRYSNEKGQMFSLSAEDAEKLGGFTLVESNENGATEDKAVRGPASSRQRRAQTSKPAATTPPAGNETGNNDGATNPPAA